jgi:transposase
MMGKRQQGDPKLFYSGFSLDRRVPADHPLRRILQVVDFDFVRPRVAGLYGVNGHVSVDPVVILKILFLLFYEKVPSERAFLRQLPLRLDWLWFCGYDLDDEIPDHSVISKARRRWSKAVFAELFRRILQQCIEAGLVDGTIVHLDSSMIAGNVSKDTLQPQLEVLGQTFYDQLDTESEDSASESADSPQKDPLDSGLRSATDPDARLGAKYGHSTLGYKDHRVVDDQCGIITATVTTPADAYDGHFLQQAIQEHRINTAMEPELAVADKQYGTTENYRYLQEEKMRACIPHQKHGSIQVGKFSHDRFRYDPQRDCFVCPAGQTLSLYDKGGPQEDHRRYRADRQTCEHCAYFEQCVTSKTWGRQVVRNVGAPFVEWADGCLPVWTRRRLMARHRYKMEGSFADAANNHGFKRARWRGLEGMHIQNLLIAAIQNLRKLLRHFGNTARWAKSLPARTAQQTLRTLLGVGAWIPVLWMRVIGNGERRPGYIHPKIPTDLALWMDSPQLESI